MTSKIWLLKSETEKTKHVHTTKMASECNRKWLREAGKLVVTYKKKKKKKKEQPEDKQA